MKGKVRIANKATKGKGKLWKRGDSSSCNAQTRKFRDKINVFDPKLSQKPESDDLNMERLNLENMVADDGRESMDVDTQSIISGTSNLSMFSNCSNQSLSQIMTRWNPASYMHRETAAVLATVAETIRERGGKESDTEYFAVLLILFNSSEKEEELVAISFLLNVLIKKLPESVKKITFDETQKVLSNVLSKEETKGNSNVSLISNLLKCLSELLKCQDLSIWKLSTTRNLFEVILNFILDPAPKIRKSAHRSVVSILKASSIVWKNEPCHHIMTPVAASFCIEKIKKARLSKENLTEAMHMINLVKDFIDVLPESHLKGCCETILRVIHLDDSTMISCGLSVFLSLFSSSSPLRGLTARQNQVLLEALRDRKPSLVNSELISLWVMVIKEGCLSLFSLDKSCCLRSISIYLSDLIECFQNDSKQIHVQVLVSVSQLIQNIIAPSFSEISWEIMVDIVQTFQRILDFKYKSAFSSIARLTEVLIESLGPNLSKTRTTSEPFMKLVKNLIDLREGYDSSFIKDIDSILAKTIKVVGPTMVLDICPIGMELIEGINFSNSWLIPILRDNVEGVCLDIFWSRFLPLAREIVKRKKKKSQEDPKSPKIKLFSLLYDQIWSLLPSFCRQPSDLETSFTKNIHTLLMNIKNNKPIRHHCLAGIRNLIRTCDSATTKNVFAQSAQSFLEMCFMIIVDPKSSSQDLLPIFETWKVFLEITDKRLIEKFFEICREKLLQLEGNNKSVAEESKSVEFQTSVKNLIDILVVLIPHLPSTSLNDVLTRVVIPRITTSQDHTHRKQGFRMLKELCKSENIKEMVEANDQVQAILLSSLSEYSKEMRTWPLDSISILCEKGLFKMNQSHIKPLIIGIILSVDKGKAKSREAAFNLMERIPYEPEQILRALESICLSSQPKPGAILIYGRFLVQNYVKMTEESRTRLFSLLDFLKSEIRAIIKAILEVIKLWLKQIPREDIQSSLFPIISAFEYIPEQHRKALSRPVKILLTRMVRMFGFETVSRISPESFGKVLKNIRKLELAKKRSKSSEDDELSLESSKQSSFFTTASEKSFDDSDSDLESTHSKKTAKSKRSSKHKRSQQHGTWIEEDKDGEVLDLTAPDANKKIITTDPSKLGKVHKKAEEFPVNSEGKLIIGGKDEGLSSSVKRKRDIDDNNEEEGDIGSINTSHQSRSTYKPGGKGIHRPIKRRKKSSAIKGLRLGDEYKAKKAKGDMKKRDAPDPFAYVPLGGSLLNRRRKNKYKGVFNKLLQKNSKTQSK
ncbi:RRP12-like protein [Brevipalpus obovatus]|uniref:RRP12-like protein n=1 Tax=Brevipalpus obovatus TaxID=246614 RepID=UPI003D9FAAB2